MCEVTVMPSAKLQYNHSGSRNILTVEFCKTQWNDCDLLQRKQIVRIRLSFNLQSRLLARRYWLRLTENPPATNNVSVVMLFPIGIDYKNCIKIFWLGRCPPYH